MAAVVRFLLVLFCCHFSVVFEVRAAAALAQGSSSSDQAIKTLIFRIDGHSKPSIFPTHYHWYTSEFANPVHIFHVYDTLFHGFSAVLTPDQAASAARHPSVLAVFEDRRRQLHTTRSPQFLGLRNQHGLWSESDYGSDIIVGVFDTGIWPERRSFLDLHLGPVPARWKGICQTGTGFPAFKCNRKLIGARFFNKGHEAAARAASRQEQGLVGGINRTVEFLSPRDADGHGTHTASTAAGRLSYQASMKGFASGTARGVAPKARLAVYKVCWMGAGCFDSDILAAFETAVSDGVDVISISIGGGEGIAAPYYLDPIAIGSFAAVARGIFVSSSAGNEGPISGSVTNLAPWMTAVGAGTIDRSFPADVTLGNGVKVQGESLYSGPSLNGTMYPLVYPGKSGMLSASLCMDNSLDSRVVKGKIVICDRGSNPRVAKGVAVMKAGGVGMILANGPLSGEGLVGDAHVLPACGVGADEGNAIKAYLSSTPLPKTTIDFQGTKLGIRPAPVVASFSARGPNGMNPEILKPDLIAPGVNILAAWTEAVGPTGLASDPRRTEFNILSGTSMSCPHVSGAAALLKSAHPDWSPAMIRSAMLTTARTLDNRAQLMTDESTGRPSTPYDFGAGLLNLEQALDPGLVFDISSQDYVSFLCGIGYEPRSVQVITGARVICPARRSPPENLNYPSMVAVMSSSVKVKRFVRTVENVGPANAVYTARVESPSRRVAVAVKPARLVFTAGVKTQSFVVTVAAASRNLPLGESGAAFGALTWTDGSHVVRNTIVVTQGDTF